MMASPVFSGGGKAGDEQTQTWAEVGFTPRWGPAQDGHRLALKPLPFLGCLVLLGGRWPSPLSLENCPRQSALGNITSPDRG